MVLIMRYLFLPLFCLFCILDANALQNIGDDNEVCKEFTKLLNAYGGETRDAVRRMVSEADVDLRNVGFKVVDKNGFERRKRAILQLVDINNDGVAEELLRTDEPIYSHLFDIALYFSPIEKALMGLDRKSVGNYLSSLNWSHGVGFDLPRITVLNNLDWLPINTSKKKIKTIEFLLPEVIRILGKNYILETEYGKKQRFIFLSELIVERLVPLCVFERV